LIKKVLSIEINQYEGARVRNQVALKELQMWKSLLSMRQDAFEVSWEDHDSDAIDLV
jgi:hypothetical protein